MDDGLFLHDIRIRDTSPAWRLILNSPVLAIRLRSKSLELARLYQARVGKKTGRLMASTDVGVRIGGHNKDRLIGYVTIADQSVVSDWKGKPFYYGEYHEEGTIRSKRAKRRKAGGRRGPRKGYHELREVAQEWRKS